MAAFIVDTNIVVADWTLHGALFTLLRGAVQKMAAKLLVPQVVMDEIRGKAEGEITQRVREISRAQKAINRLVPYPIDAGDTAALVEGYMGLLHGSLDELGARTLPYPTISHDKIVGRIIRAARPFNEGERGYRDFLIWMTILDYVRTHQDETIVFVSENVRDFALDNRWHPDLLADLERMHIVEDRVKLVTSREALKALVLLQGDHDGTPLSVGDLAGIDTVSLVNSIEQAYPDWRSETALDEYQYDLDLPDAFESPVLDAIDDIDEAALVWGTRTDDGVRVLEIAFRGECQISGFMDKSEYWGVYYTDRDVEVMDSDWNDYSVWVVTHRTCRIRLWITLEPDDSIRTVEVQEIELEANR